MTEAQDAHTESAWASAQALWRQRSRLLKGSVSRERLVGLENRLLADLWRLSQTTEPTLAGSEHLVLTTAVRVLGKTPVNALVTELLGEKLEDHADDLWSMIGLLGKGVWQPVLAALANEPECPATLRWQLLGFVPDLVPFNAAPPLPDSFTPDSLLPGQIRYAAHQGHWQATDIARTWPLDAPAPGFEPDLSALILAVHREQPQQAAALVNRALASDLANPLVLAWAAALALPEAAIPLQQGFTEGTVDARLLVVHGHANHLDFCLALLEQPRTNALGAGLWQSLTAETLPQVARLSVVGENPGKAAANKDPDTLADAGSARAALERFHAEWPARQHRVRQPEQVKRVISARFGRDMTVWELAYQMQHPQVALSATQSVWVRLAQLNAVEAI
ncbi:hypothetical protein [Saccharospirillum impatiens]|uniref:hypothetical protein n=1 Tax=Saccharospirillum impatiens TaxID=169438 RepID=UPI000491CFA1|nr:hypothetical protein [Saccharospirillum impatiens]